MRPRRALLLLLATLAAGCMSSPEGTGPAEVGGGLPPPTARLEIASLAIAPRDAPDRAQLYEDDAAAIVAYVVRAPADAPGPESAFVTYVLDGVVIDVQQITLRPSEERRFERVVELNPQEAGRTIHAEVRVAHAKERVETTVKAWPRAGADALPLGPLTIRADFGLIEHDGRSLLNLTITRAREGDVAALRVATLCLDGSGGIVRSAQRPLDAPDPGKRFSQDVYVASCGPTRYALEFVASTADGEASGRLLLA